MIIVIFIKHASILTSCISKAILKVIPDAFKPLEKKNIKMQIINISKI